MVPRSAAIRTVARQASRQISRQGPSYVDPGLQTPIGVTLGELINYWNELSAISLYDHTVMQRTKSPSRVVYPRDKFVSHMAKEAEAGISQQEADEITAKLTINRRGNSTHDRVAQHAIETLCAGGRWTVPPHHPHCPFYGSAANHEVAAGCLPRGTLVGGYANDDDHRKSPESIIENPHPGVCDFRLAGLLSVGVFWLVLGMSGVGSCHR